MLWPERPSLHPQHPAPCYPIEGGHVLAEVRRAQVFLGAGPGGRQGHRPGVVDDVRGASDLGRGDGRPWPAAGPTAAPEAGVTAAAGTGWQGAQCDAAAAAVRGDPPPTKGGTCRGYNGVGKQTEQELPHGAASDAGDEVEVGLVSGARNCEGTSVLPVGCGWSGHRAPMGETPWGITGIRLLRHHIRKII
ncbi:hypothetical protein GCM10012280_62950 [Wenjunlia tyrosinilytica]|uniref:Uncharacterized protein n=1 Tax=Wenjunlia tyrosinilytica TaxID=1544741 RepID=A0A917ZXK2_9ACTN|nr:hypothetical protein GCM10012280_62950 [Wenjunlia tyrosinilytica]